MKTPTIKVKANTPSGFIIINASDFDEKVHQEFLPSAEELREEAKVLGIKVGGNAKAETIAKKIEEAKSELNEEEL